MVEGAGHRTAGRMVCQQSPAVAPGHPGCRCGKNSRRSTAATPPVLPWASVCRRRPLELADARSAAARSIAVDAYPALICGRPPMWPRMTPARLACSVTVHLNLSTVV